MMDFQRQQGAVLAVALILLLVITVIGVSTFKATGLEEKMAANAQFKSIVFQGSESAIAATWSDLSYLSDALVKSEQDSDADTAGQQIVWPTKNVANGVSNMSMASEARFVEERKDFVQDQSATSLAMDSSAAVCYYTYEIRGTAEITNTNSKNTNVQGVRHRGVCETSSPE